MSNRLDQEREKRLKPKRIEYAIQKIKEAGIDSVQCVGDRIEFEYKGNTINHYAYSGWHSGKGIKDGRGIENLLKQVKS